MEYLRPDTAEEYAASVAEVQRGREIMAEQEAEFVAAMNTPKESHAMEATHIIAQGQLQADILEKCEGDTPEDTKMYLQDMASGHDPIYQFAGWIWTHDMVMDAYNEYKADVIEAIAELASYQISARPVQDVIEWAWNGKEYFPNHADFAGRCLSIAITYHAGELLSQVEQ